MVKNEMVEMDYGCGRCVVGKGKAKNKGPMGRDVMIGTL